jgi:hypothetical protein
VIGKINRPTPTGLRLVPQVSFIEVDLVSSQKSSQFILKAELAMMRLLLIDVLPDSMKIGLTDREIRVARLPFKLGKWDPLAFQPHIRHSFEFLDPVRL